MSRKLFLVLVAFVVSVSASVESAVAIGPTFLNNPGVYTATPSSTFSDFPGMEVDKLFDGNNNSDWAIDGYLGNNAQGRDEGWVSATLNDTYLITHLRFAPRKASGNTDAIDKAYFWVSSTPFGVNVTSAASTNAFKASAVGGAPNLTLGPFASFADVDYAFPSTLAGKYLLGRFVNTTDGDSNRNLGVRTIAIGQIGTVPEPATLALGALAALGVLGGRRRSG